MTDAEECSAVDERLSGLLKTCGHKFDGPSLPSGNRLARAVTMADRPQGYAFGWYVACNALAMGIDAALLARGFPLEIAFATLYLAMGLAAVVVRPWSWYVLLVSLAVLPLYGGLYIVFVAHDWQNRLLIAFGAVLMAGVTFAYFYKRRAMFGAKGRWRRLELWCPRLMGPQTRNAGVAGFAGLSNTRRLFFVAVLGALILLIRLTGS